MEPFSPEMNNERRLRIVKIGVIAFLVLAILMVIGGLLTPTSSGMWDGAFPSGEFHILIKNADGQPIPGAVLNVLGRENGFAYGYPFDNYSSNSELVSDEQGLIIALHEYQDIEFGGRCTEYFWVYTKCSDGPEYFGQIAADGYQVKDFSINELIFQPAYEEAVARLNSPALESIDENEMPVHKIIIVLENE